MKKIIASCLIIFLCFFDAYIYAAKIQKDIASNVIRLHVIADSDDKDAQEVKLRVRDSILEYVRKFDFENVNDAYEKIYDVKDELQFTAQKTLRENGFEYDVTVEIGECDFPRKDYDLLSFPEGKYVAVRVNLGEAKGQNWWCVMYPTLCFSDSICDDSSAYNVLESSLQEDSFKIITGQAEFRFKILEWF